MNRDFCLKERNCFECALKSPLCDILNSEELEILNSNRYEIFFKAGETIRKQGTFMSHVISIQSGQCKMYLEGLSNKNIIIRIIQPHSFILVFASGKDVSNIDQLHTNFKIDKAEAEISLTIIFE